MYINRPNSSSSINASHCSERSKFIQLQNNKKLLWICIFVLKPETKSQ